LKSESRKEHPDKTEQRKEEQAAMASSIHGTLTKREKMVSQAKRPSMKANHEAPMHENTAYKNAVQMVGDDDD
jgi:hypothetical protein